MARMNWQSRIVGHGEEDPTQLLANPRNWRIHPKAQQDALAGALDQVGWVQQVTVNKTTGHLVDGHLRVELALRREEPTVPVTYVELTPEEEGLVLASLDPIAAMAGQDDEKLRQLLAEVAFDSQSLADALSELVPESRRGGLTDADAIPDVDASVVHVRTGDLWLLGDHRLMCGDSTSSADVARLMGGEVAMLVHADPPYGMGKESDGVANDNLYREELDAFQMSWWNACRPHLSDNASAYVWGNAPDLWRWWYLGGLALSELLEIRNEVVWAKPSGQGMRTEAGTAYATASERCLFIQIGRQSFQNINSHEFPEAWESVRARLAAAVERAGVGPSDVKRICGVGMYGHWFTRSQFTLIPEKHYRLLQDAYPGAFSEPWRDLHAEWVRVNAPERVARAAPIGEVRSYFDNTHDTMRDVWEFSVVIGNERHGHATPKPVAMIERCIRSSSRPGAVVIEPFSGSGTTIIAAEQLGRRCYAMELEPRYVQVAIERWEKFTGRKAVKADG